LDGRKSSIPDEKVISTPLKELVIYFHVQGGQGMNAMIANQFWMVFPELALVASSFCGTMYHI
jgi:hypothetical protein